MSSDPSEVASSDPPDVTSSDPSAVHGTLLSPLGDPVAGARLRVGQQELVTDGAGKFSLNGVADHYDLVATDGATRVLAYLGLTTRTPIVRGWDSSMRRSTTIAGTFSGGFGAPWSPSTATGLWRNGAVLEFLGPPDEKTASYGPAAVQWRSDVNPIDIKYLTLQYQTSGGSVSGWAAALTDMTMTD
ncbi:MAG TPA: hypothetical protein VNG33_12585, partial [Polyangiaceae bacterium]|nr:hypothetical protein [Polyangiaceae bacterium]